MRQRLGKNVVTALAVFLIFWGCGAQVDVGKNNDRDPTGKERASGANEESTSAAGMERAGSCFNSAGQDNPVAAAVCQSFPEARRQEFSSIREELCTKKVLSNLLRAECGWDGSGSLNRFMKVLRETPVESDERSYDYLVAYSLTLGNTQRNYMDTIFFAYSRPEEFAQRYRMPHSTKIAPVTGVEQQGPYQVLRYEVKIPSPISAVEFTSEMLGYKLNDSTEVVIDRGVEKMIGITLRNHLTIATRLEDGRLKIVVVEERRLDDHGKHEIARGKMRDHDRDKMEMIYDNSLK